jgi:hypothetical protein
MSGSVCKCARDLEDEGLPLILQLFEEEISTGPVRKEEASHSQRVSNGAAMLLGSWPEYLTSACISAAALTVLTTIMIATPIVTITMLDNNMRSELELGRELELPGIETHCHYEKEADKMTNKGVKASDYDILNLIGLQNISSFEVVRKNINATDVSIPAQRNVFFVTATDNLSTRHLCAVESAARIASNYHIFIITLSINNTKANIKSYKRFEKLSNLYPNIKLLRFKGEEYFHDSPMRGILQHNNIPLSLVEFAARILTLWRYGGITYDLDLITVDNTSRRPYPVPSGDNVMISTDGGNVMSVRSQCQAFLYDMMTSLTLLYAKRHENCDVSSNDVIKHTLKTVCYNASKALEPDTLLQEEPYTNCKGVSGMPHHTICRRAEQRTAGSSDCVWALCNVKNVYVGKHLCPISYRQYTLKEPYEFTRTATHKFRHKHFY